MQRTSKGVYIFLAILLACILVLGLLLIIVMPFFIIVEIIIGIFEFILVKKIKAMSKVEKKAKSFEYKVLSQGYLKVCNDFYINEQLGNVIINNNKYNFDKIIDCNLVEDYKTTSQTYGTNKTKSKGKNKKHIAPVKAVVGGALFGSVGAIIGGTSGKTDTKSKAKTTVNTVTTDIDYLTDLYINITVNDLNNPNIILNIKGRINPKKNSSIYNEYIKIANKSLSTLKLIISRNNKNTYNA